MKHMLLSLLFLLIGLGSFSHGQAQEMMALNDTVYQAISLGRSSGRNYPAHVAIIDARTRPMTISFPNLSCSGILRNKRYPDRARFTRWPVLRDYNGLSQFDLQITQGICVLAGHVVLHHGTGGNCLFGCRRVSKTYFYFGADGSASGAEMTENADGLSMTSDEAIDIIDFARTR
jgi:hypothetical protein